MCRVEEGDAQKWLAEMIDTLQHDDQTKVFVTLWAIWHARRKALHEQVYQSPLLIHHFVENFLADLKLASEQRKKSPTKPPVPSRLENQCRRGGE
jgi:hypothetical protein